MECEMQISGCNLTCMEGLWVTAASTEAG